LLSVGTEVTMLDQKTDTSEGQMPQAFSHLALIEAAGRIIAAERLSELGGT